jgi:hypothetical protein
MAGFLALLIAAVIFVLLVQTTGGWVFRGQDAALETSNTAYCSGGDRCDPESLRRS